MIGKKISQYRIIEKIGEGGMGVVYKADDTVLRRSVVLKFLPPEHAESEERIERFLREARSASALNHPNIVTMHNVVSEGATIAIVMEHVEGKTLDELIPRGGLPLDEVLDYAAQIADALAAAHQAGIIHRDIKPGNVMVTSSGVVKVLDFGLAKCDQLIAIDPESRNETLMTRAGVVAGTPSYMSPEQILGSPLDSRSDIFSFGATLYAMLVGEPPFRATESTSVLHAVVHDREPPVSAVHETLPLVLDAIVGKTLEKNREARFQSMSEVGEALRRLRRAVAAGDDTSSVGIGGLEESKPPETLLARGGHRSGRRWMAAGAGIVLVAVAATLVPDVRERIRVLLDGAARAPSVGQVQSATRDPETAYEFIQQGNRLLELSYRTGYIDRAAESFQKALALEPESAPAYAGLAKTYWRKYGEEKDAELLERATNTIEEALRLDGQLTGARVTRALIRLTKGERDAARQEFEEVVLLDPANDDAHRGLGEYHRREGNREAAEAAYMKAVELDPSRYRNWQDLGVFYYRSGRYPDAESAFSRSVELAPDLSSAYRNLAAVQHMQSDYSAASANLQKALEIEPDPRGYNNLGTLYFFQGLYQKAVSALEKAVEGGSTDYRIWGNLGDAYRWTPGNEEKATRAFETAVRMVREAMIDTAEDPEKQGLLAEYLAKLGDAAGALAALEGFAGEDPYDVFNAAQAAEIAGARDQALVLLEQSLEAGLSLEEVRKDPELAALRKDPRLQLLLTEMENRKADSDSGD